MSPIRAKWHTAPVVKVKALKKLVKFDVATASSKVGWIAVTKLYGATSEETVFLKGSFVGQKHSVGGRETGRI